MSKIIITLLSLFIAQTTFAQSGYVYLEVDKNLPVNIKLNDKEVKNNNKGYIIIPKVNKGENKLDFNFNNPGFKQHSFFFTQYNDKSQGYRLKRVENNEFVLVDLVNKRSLRHNQKNSNPILASNKVENIQKENQVVTQNVKKIKKERGVIQILTADNNTPTKNKETYKTKRNRNSVAKKNKAKNNKSKIQSRTTLYTDTPKQRKTYAMYEQHKAAAKSTSSKDKNYRKINRDKKRARKAAEKAAQQGLDIDDAPNVKKQIDNNNKQKEIAKRQKELKKQEASLRKADKKKRKLADQKKREAEDLKEPANLSKGKIIDKEKIKEQKRLEKVQRKKEKGLAKLKETERLKQEKAKRNEAKLVEEAKQKKANSIAEKRKESKRLAKIQEAKRQKIENEKRRADQIREEELKKEQKAVRAAKKKEELVNRQIEKDKARAKRDKEDKLEQLKRQEQDAKALSNTKIKRKKRKKKSVSDVDDYISSIKKEIINPEPTQKRDDAKKYDPLQELTPINASDYVTDRCPSTVDSKQLNDLNTQLKERYDDQARLSYAKKNMKSSCYTTDHIINLLESFETQNGKYKLVKELYPYIADQSNMPRLYNSFKFKSYRKRISDLSN